MNASVKKLLGVPVLIILMGLTASAGSTENSSVTIKINNNTAGELVLYSFSPALVNQSGGAQAMQQLVSYTSPMAPLSEGEISLSPLPFDSKLTFLQARTSYEIIEDADCLASVAVSFNGRAELADLTCGISDKQPRLPPEAPICETRYTCASDLNSLTVFFSRKAPNIR